MSHYTTCIIEFNRTCLPKVLSIIEKMEDCYIAGYLTEYTVVIHFHGRAYEQSEEWRALVRTLANLENEEGDDLFHTMTYDENSFNEAGSLCGVAYVGLIVDDIDLEYSSFYCFMKDMKSVALDYEE